MEVCVTRFNTKTFEENQNWKIKNNTIGCIYGTPIKICERILPHTNIIVLEMNNTKNIIEGMGIIKNKLEKENKKNNKIYSDNNYNRFIYKSVYRIDKSSFNTYEKKVIKCLENMLFKSAHHCKRGQGIQKIPKNIREMKEFNFIKFLTNLYIKKFVNLQFNPNCKIIIKD
jgi:hypothetical protein